METYENNGEECFSMKKETMIKVLVRYERGLRVMRDMAITEKEESDAMRYEFDRNVFEQAIKELRKE